MTARFQAVVETLHAEVEIAVRYVETGYRHLQAKQQSMAAAEADVRYLQRRWELLPGDDRSASFLLEDLLDAQDRLAFEETGLAQAQVDYARSLLELKRATGTLLHRDAIPPRETAGRAMPGTAVGTSKPAGR
jgi:outer membrane protein TolC